MPLERLGVSTPATNVDQSLVTFTNPHLVSVIASNTAVVSTPVAKATIYVVPANATQESQYAYLAYQTILSLGQTFETFRFGVNAGDSIFVRSTNGEISFSCTGILQDDAVQPSDLTQQFTNKTIRGNFNTVYLDQGTTAERRTDAEIGYVRYNTEFDALEVRTPGGWGFVGEIVADYTPDNLLNWDGTPSDVYTALNELASRIKALES